MRLNVSPRPLIHDLKQALPHDGSLREYFDHLLKQQKGLSRLSKLEFGSQIYLIGRPSKSEISGLCLKTSNDFLEWKNKRTVQSLRGFFRLCFLNNRGRLHLLSWPGQGGSDLALSYWESRHGKVQHGIEKQILMHEGGFVWRPKTKGEDLSIETVRNYLCDPNRRDPIGDLWRWRCLVKPELLLEGGLLTLMGYYKGASYDLMGIQLMTQQEVTVWDRSSTNYFQLTFFKIFSGYGLQEAIGPGSRELGEAFLKARPPLNPLASRLIAVV